MRGAAGVHLEAVGASQRDDVGQVILALRVVAAQRADPAAQRGARRGDDAGVDFGDRTLGGGRVLVLDDALHAPGGVAHDAAVAGGVVELDAEQPQRAGAGGVEQRLQRRRAHQRHVAVQHQHHRVVVERVGRLQHRVAGAELRLLLAERRAGGGKRGADLLGAVADDDDAALRVELRGGIQHVREQRAPGQRLQHLGPRRLHAGALAGREHDDVQRRLGLKRVGIGHPCILGWAPARRPAKRPVGDRPCGRCGRRARNARKRLNQNPDLFSDRKPGRPIHMSKKAATSSSAAIGHDSAPPTSTIQANAGL
ncbi:hypothetical protein GALL_313750 [mine drainage metagenome]|uniref:Uncharacterized protein n=1 Tax=mine drainage metagenome TaxID=410659 RepID=A0A1J5QTX9_9ZZZZ